jgi:hypothetical protein
MSLARDKSQSIPDQYKVQRTGGRVAHRKMSTLMIRYLNTPLYTRANAHFPTHPVIYRKNAFEIHADVAEYKLYKKKQISIA